MTNLKGATRHRPCYGKFFDDNYCSSCNDKKQCKKANSIDIRKNNMVDEVDDFECRDTRR